MTFNPQLLHSEIYFKTTRSGGKGGQHVNKVSTAVQLFFDIDSSKKLNPEQKSRIKEKLKNRINLKGEIYLAAQSDRSQAWNKRVAIQKFDKLILDALKKAKKRIPMALSKNQKMKRLDQKKKHSTKKVGRGTNWFGYL